MYRCGITLLVALLLAVPTILATTPVRAQTSCMHCNFAHGKCNMFKPGQEAVCAKEREECIRQCKAEAADQPAAQTKAGDKKEKK